MFTKAPSPFTASLKCLWPLDEQLHRYMVQVPRLMYPAKVVGALHKGQVVMWGTRPNFTNTAVAHGTSALPHCNEAYCPELPLDTWYWLQISKGATYANAGDQDTVNTA